MKVGIIQSNYIPWRGYFDFIDSVDLFVFHDDLQYTKGDWRNRNMIKTAGGLNWLSVPVKYAKTSQLISETAIDYSVPWHKSHVNQFKANYFKAPYYSDALAILQETFSCNHTTISALNIHLIKCICDYLGITTPFAMSADYGVTGAKTERLISLITKIGASTYLSGPAASNYLDVTALKSSGIALEYKTYDYEPYHQLWGDFVGNVSILDLIANCGFDSRRYLKSLTPNEVVVK